MYQTDQATASSTLPAPAAAGTQGFFTNGNPASGVAATIVDADWLNMIQQELISIVAAAGITPSKTTYNQVLSAIKRIGQSTVVLADTGAVNAYSATNAVPLVAGTWVNGVVQQIAVAHTNNGASTYAPDGLAPIPIYGLGLQPLQQGEMFAGGTAILMKQTIAGVNGGNPICVLLECAGGAQQIAPATASQHAVQLGQLASGTVNVGNRAQFASSSSFTVPANVTTIWYSGCAGGGGGGGSGGISGVTASWSSTSGGGGGQPGQFVRRVPITVTPGQTLTISIGAAGTPGSNGTAGGTGGNGGAGGNTTISGTGVSVTLSGGAGGTGSAAISGSNNVVGAPGSAGGIGADDGFWGIAVSGYGYDVGGQGGRGGNTPFGTSGGATKMQSAARAGAGYGAGGSGGGGCVTQNSGVGYAGAAGGAGYLEFEW